MHAAKELGHLELEICRLILRHEAGKCGSQFFWQFVGLKEKACIGLIDTMWMCCLGLDMTSLAVAHSQSGIHTSVINNAALVGQAHGKDWSAPFWWLQMKWMPDRLSASAELDRTGTSRYWKYVTILLMPLHFTYRY